MQPDGYQDPGQPDLKVLTVSDLRKKNKKNTGKTANASYDKDNNRFTF